MVIFVVELIKWIVDKGAKLDSEFRENRNYNSLFCNERIGKTTLRYIN